mgnify:CR=1 FL=1
MTNNLKIAYHLTYIFGHYGQDYGVIYYDILW